MFKKIPDVSRFPVRISHDNWAMGIGLTAFAAFFLTLAAYGDPGSDTLGWLITLTFGVIGLPIGVVLMGQRDNIEIDRETVTVRQRVWRKRTTWSEPLANFHGVLRRVESRFGHNKRYRLYNVELLHPEEDKTLLLHKSQKEDGIRAFWETAARTFELPALEVGEQGIIGRQVADLDKSIQELAREGRLEDDFDASRAPPKGIAWRRDEDRLVVSVRPSYSSGIVWIVTGLALMVAIPALLGVTVGLISGEPTLVYGFSVVLVPAAAVAAWMTTVKRWIVITPSTLRVFGRWLCGPYPHPRSGRGEVAVGQIETVIRRPDVGRIDREELRIESDTGGITIGPLIEEQGRWLEHFIVSATIGAPGGRLD